MEGLEKNELEESFKTFKKAERLIGISGFMKATTYNNMACYYKRANKLRTALKYLQ